MTSNSTSDPIRNEVDHLITDGYRRMSIEDHASAAPLAVECKTSMQNADSDSSSSSALSMPKDMARKEYTALNQHSFKEICTMGAKVIRTVIIPPDTAHSPTTNSWKSTVSKKKHDYMLQEDSLFKTMKTEYETIFGILSSREEVKLHNKAVNQLLRIVTTHRKCHDDLRKAGIVSQIMDMFLEPDQEERSLHLIKLITIFLMSGDEQFVTYVLYVSKMLRERLQVNILHPNPEIREGVLEIITLIALKEPSFIKETDFVSPFLYDFGTGTQSISRQGQILHLIHDIFPNELFGEWASQKLTADRTTLSLLLMRLPSLLVKTNSSVVVQVIISVVGTIRHQPDACSLLDSVLTPEYMEALFLKLDTDNSKLQCVILEEIQTVLRSRTNIYDDVIVKVGGLSTLANLLNSSDSNLFTMALTVINLIIRGKGNDGATRVQKWESLSAVHQAKILFLAKRNTMHDFGVDSLTKELFEMVDK